MLITGQFNFLCSVESSEIDLSEFQNENPEDGVGDTQNGTGQRETEPTEAPAESVSGNAGRQYSIGCFVGSDFKIHRLLVS